MGDSVFKQNSFSRSIINDQKMGAYYTDTNHCKRIGKLFTFPEEEVCILEPSIGDASAVEAVTGCIGKENLKVFGVELNPLTCKKLNALEDRKVDYLLNADFLNGVKISHNVFSFCFSNPPYGVANDVNKRYETLFVDKMANYIMVDGILALVIPYYVLTDMEFLKTFFKWFQPLATFRFDDDVYQQFKQIVVIGMKRKSIGYLRYTFDEYFQTIDAIEKLPYLPKLEDNVTRIPVLPSLESKIEYFTTIEFDANKAATYLEESSLYQKMIDSILVPRFTNMELGRPPVPLKKDLLYLCALSGGGQGLVGNAEHRDLHLQRGVVEVVKSEETRELSDDSVEIVETSYTKIHLNVIENDGTITVLS